MQDLKELNEVITAIKEEIRQGADALTTSKSVYEFKKTFLDNKQGRIGLLMKEMRNVANDQKAEFGKTINGAKEWANNFFDELDQKLKEKEQQQRYESEKIDITLPGRKPELGNAHPLNLVRQELEDLFIGLGYQVIEGDDIVDDEYCFERANIPKDHPARDMQDSLYIDPNRLLRTHTTAIQMVVLEESAPNLPIKVVCPGKVYRRDDDDATHSHQFMQMEGLVIGEKVTLADLKGTLEFMAKKLFGQDRQIRFRPSYFPFTEPSVEVDVSCHICNGKGCPTCKGTGWIEILGAGEVHPNVLKMAGYDPEKCSGFAFGVGIERVAMLKYGIDDIRHFYTNDKRFNSTFKRYE